MQFGQDATTASGDTQAGARYRFADVEYDEVEGQLRVAGQAVVVEPRPLRLLVELLRHVNEVVTKEELLDSVWEGRPTVDHVLANAVSKLRTAMGEQGAARLLTVPRIGYRLLGPVQRLEARGVEYLRATGQPVPGREGYVLERPLGQSARSDVWLARHPKLGHSRVFKFADDGPRLAALKREYTLYRVLRQELGERADIAKVIDSNFSSAPYFLECEFGGESLHAWAERDDQLASLSCEQRLALVVQVVRAASAAHSVGVLHKDLKPGNVLVSGEAGKLHLRLTDFGSGQVLDRARLEALQLTASGFTQTHDVAADSRTGTFAYMAPELLAGQSPTLQSDVYALGLMLYQLLAGDLRRPLATGWERDVDDELLREDIRAATEGRSDERLGSATELLARLEQLSPRRTARAAQLDRERQSAELLARQQRHRARLPWVLAALGLLALGLISSLTLYARERLALAAAKVETRRADAFVEFLTKDVLASDDLSRVGGLKPASILDVLRRAEASVSGRFAGQPLLEAKVRHHLSKVFLRLTSHSDAENQLQLAVRLLRSLPNGNELVLADVLLDGVSLYLSRHYIEGAVQALEEAEHLGGTALREPAGNLARHHARARTQLLLEQGKVEMALAEANRLSEMMQNFEAVPLDEQFEISRIRAEALVASGDFAAANKLLAGLARPPFGIERVGEATYFRAVTRIASALTVSGRAKEAERLVLDLLGSLEEQTPISEWHVGSANNLLGMIGERLGNYADSAHRLENAMRTFQGLFGENHENTRIVEMNLATAYLHLGRWKDALTLCERVRPWARGEKQAERERVLKSLSARALIGLDRPREALVELGDVSVDLVTRKISTPTDDFGLIALAFRGMALMDSGRFAEGKQLLGETLRRIKPSGEPSPAFEKSWDAYMKRSR